MSQPPSQPQPLSLPPLLVAGNLVATSNQVAQAELDKIVPVNYIVDWIRGHRSATGIANRVLFVKAETASGKSIVIPPALYRAFVYTTRGAGIICTQPRVITAIENVREMVRWNADLFSMPGTIGWGTKNNKMRAARFGLFSATIGTLLAQLINFSDEDLIARYSIIMIDEAHERTTENDIVLSYLKAFLRRNATNPQCPMIILASATIDFAPFAEYFGVELASNFIWCRGESKGFDTIWPAHPTPNFIESTVETIGEIIRRGTEDEVDLCDILVFLPGNREIKEVAQLLAPLERKVLPSDAFVTLKLTRQTVVEASEEYRKIVYLKASEIRTKTGCPRRKVVLSTVVAETGISLRGLKYVIDGGFSREMQFIPAHGMRCLITVPESKAAAIQRRGRVGRFFRGIFYPMYPEYIFKLMREQSYPAIIVNDVGPILLRIMRLQIDAQVRRGSTDPRVDITEIDLPTMPTVDAINAAVMQLYTLGFVTLHAPNPLSVPEYDFDNVRKLAGGGFGMSRLGLLAQSLDFGNLHATRMVLAGYGYAGSHAAMDLLTIAAIVHSGGLLPTPKRGACEVWISVYNEAFPNLSRDVAAELPKLKLMICDEFIDSLLVFCAARRALLKRRKFSDLEAWCEKKSVNFEQVVEIIGTREDLIESMLLNRASVLGAQPQRGIDACGLADSRTLEDIIARVRIIKQCIADGFGSNALTYSNGVYHSRSGLAVVVPNVLTFGCKDSLDAMPKRVYCAEIVVTKVVSDIGTYRYEPTAKLVSVADGF